jgi:hypothetical protein
MPDLHPAPVAEDIDEHAARRSIRLILIIMGAVVLFGGLAGFLLARQIGHRSSGTDQHTSVWPLVILVAVLGITIVAMGILVRRQYRRPRFRRVMQYGWRRRSRIAKDLRRGRALSADDMPVARAMVELVLSRRRWSLIILWLLPIIWLFNGLIQHGFLQWFDFGLAAFWLVYVPLLLRQQRQLIRNYERQNIPTVGNHQHDTASGTAG